MTKENKNITSNNNNLFTNILEHIRGFINYLNQNVMTVNNSKFFAGIVMILLNVGSKFIQIQFSRSTEEYMKYTITKQLLVFAMAWMGTRDIYASLGLTAIFTILSEYLFNEESSLCIVPQQYRVLQKLLDTNNDNVVTEDEITAAIGILEKAKKEKQRALQKENFKNFDFKKI